MKRKKKPEIKLIDDYCIGCIYLTDFHYDNVKSVCYYSVITGKKKPCKCGEECTVKKTGERMIPKKFSVIGG